METLILDIEDYSAVPLRPWVVKLWQAKTYSSLPLLIAAVGSVTTTSVSPALAVSADWDWDSESRQEETQKPRGQALDSTESDIAMDYQTGRTVKRQPPTGDRQPQQTEQPQEEPTMPNNQAQAPDPTTIQVIDDWRATRQSPEERARELNPGVEKDCNGKPFDDNEVFQQVEVDESGNATSAGLEEIKRHAKAYCQSNPSAPECQPDKDGDVG